MSNYQIFDKKRAFLFFFEGNIPEHCLSGKYCSVIKIISSVFNDIGTWKITKEIGYFIKE